MSLAIGIGAEDWDDHDATLAEGLESKYQPMLKIGEGIVSLDALKKEKTTYPGRVDTYLDVGFLYRSVEQAEYQKIVAFEEETGIKVLYPLINNNEYTPDPNNANYWYKMVKNQPVSTDATGDWDYITYADLQEGVPLEDNYKRDADGNVKYYEYTGGGDASTAQYKIRVLYYNYYLYQNGFEPEYLFGTDSQGYDLMLRLAGAIQLSLFVAICVSAINFTIGALYGSTEGYYGGVADIIMQRISEILGSVPFVVAATLFQLHLADKAGVLGCLLFAFVLTGWIGMSDRVRMQFYRFKGHEYVLAARTLGAKDRRLIFKHIFPNSLGTIITGSVLAIPGVIFSESMLSYLHIINLETSSLTSIGTMLSNGQGYLGSFPHIILFPALFISILEISFNLFGNGLRDAFNPSLRGADE
jgi:oligopeptide transport system permease protein